MMKPVLYGCNSYTGSAMLQFFTELDDDIVYSPIKYRETEGVKEIRLKALYQSLCLRVGTTNTNQVEIWFISSPTESHTL